LKVSTYIARFLRENGICVVFELQGGMITRLIDAIHHEGGIKIVSMHHEQAAAMAADAYGRITNKPGVALATSGPGATNLLTGIGNCYFDSVPAIFITGQVNLKEQKGNLPTRQIGFQETDIVTMAKPVTKMAVAIKSAREIPHVFEEALRIATGGRPGPVLIDIPMDIQNEEMDPVKIKENALVSIKDKGNEQSFIHDYLDSLKSSKRPLVLAGRGIRASGSAGEFLDFINKCRIPVVTSLLGLDVLPYQHKQRIGFIGTYGNRWANYALGNCDLLLVLGSRMDLRQTGIDTDSFRNGKFIYHVDTDEAELNNRIGGCITLKSDLSDFFSIFKISGSSYMTPSEWTDEIAEKKQARPDVEELEGISGINPNVFIHKLSKASTKARVFTADVGNNQMWSSQSLELEEDQLFITSGGMGAMGYSLPAAIGSSLSSDIAPVVSISGDGGFQINIQELQTIVRDKLPVKIVILNNRCLGMIRQFQDAYFNSCYQATVWGYNTPDFEQLAKAYGIESFTVDSDEAIDEGLELMWKDPARPFLLNVIIDIHTNVYPKMMFGSPLTIMEPIFNY
jgi:acetolactate synthase I/II/III large subunit